MTRIKSFIAFRRTPFIIAHDPRGRDERGIEEESLEVEEEKHQKPNIDEIDALQGLMTELEHGLESFNEREEPDP